LTERPEEITEEEVPFHRERKICLMCKSKVSRKVNICPECNALYCIKCSDMIENSENAYWVCNAPIDESKPSKPFKEHEAPIIESFLEGKKGTEEPPLKPKK
jgi:hypothetical protein